MSYFDENGNWIVDDSYGNMPSSGQNLQPEGGPPITPLPEPQGGNLRTPSADNPPIQPTPNPVGAALSGVANYINPMRQVDRVFQPISRVLGYFDVDRNALASGAKSLQEGHGFFPGVWQGGTFQNKTSWPTDVFGLSDVTPETPWWKAGAINLRNFAIDEALRPSNYLGFLKGLKIPKFAPEGLGEAVSQSGPMTAAKNYTASSAVGGALMHELPGITVDGVNFGNVENLIDAVTREYSMNPRLKELQKIKDRADLIEAKQGGPWTPEEKFTAIEKSLHDWNPTGEDLGPQFANWPSDRIPPAMEPWVNAVEPARQMKIQAREDLRQQQADMGLPQSPMISENDLNYLTHGVIRGQNPEAEFQPSTKFGKVKINPNPYEEMQRNVVNWFDANDQYLGRGIAADPRSPITMEETPQGKQYFYTDRYGNQIQAFPKQASLIEKQLSYPNKDFNFDWPTALVGGIQTDVGAQGFNAIMGGLKDQGALIPLPPGEAPRVGWREPKAPPMRGYQTPEAVANRMDNLFGNMVDPESVLGGIGAGLKAFNQSGPGRWIQDYKTMLVRNLVGMPGFPVAKGLTGEMKLYQSGIPSWRLPDVTARGVEIRNADNLIGEKWKPVVEGISNSDLNSEIAKRGAYLGDVTELGPQPGGYGTNLQRYAERQPETTLGGIKSTVATGLDYAGKPVKAFNDAILGVAREQQNTFRAAATSWYLNDRFPNFSKLDPAAQQIALDQAVHFAMNEATVNRTNLTPFENELRKSLFPFYAFTRGSIGLGLKHMAEDPGRMARVGHALDMIFTAPSPELKEIMQPDMAESLPTMGIGRHPWNADEKGNAPNPPWVFPIGRYVPQGEFEKLTARPDEVIGSMLNPLPRALIETPTNRNLLTGQVIDPVTGNFFKGLVAPLTGQPYMPASQRLFGQTIPRSWDYLMNMIPGGNKLRYLSRGAASLGITADPYNDLNTMADYGQWATGLGKMTPVDIPQQFQGAQHRVQQEASALTPAINKAALALGQARESGNQRAMDKAEADLQKFIDWQNQLKIKEADIKYPTD